MSALGLGGYSSSEGEEDVATETVPRQVSSTTSVHSVVVALTPTSQKPALEPNEDEERNKVPSVAAPGPAPKPSDPTSTPPPELEEDTSPSSPYTRARSQVRNLTMPPGPDFDILPSPPGSPQANSTKKSTQFLSYKKQATHLNERVLRSSALRNPELPKKLTEFAEISQKNQYKSSLPMTTAVRTQYPESAHADQLTKAHKKIAAERESEQKGKRSRLDFVAGKSEGGDASGQPMKKSRTRG